MPLIIPPGFAQVNYIINLQGDSEPMVVTCGHDVSEFGGDFEEAASAAWGFFCRSGGPVEQMSQLYSCGGVDLYAGNDSGGAPTVIEFSNTPVVGQDPAAPLPQNCAVLVRKVTGAGGRRGRGRLYMPGTAEGSVDAIGVIGSSKVEQWQDAFDLWFTGLTAGAGSFLPLPPVILHRSEGAGTEPPPTPITSFGVQSRIATQRRRLRP